MKKCLIACSTFLFACPLLANASTLTASQVSSIISLLEVFGINQQTIASVQAALVPIELNATNFQNNFPSIYPSPQMVSPIVMAVSGNKLIANGEPFQVKGLTVETTETPPSVLLRDPFFWDPIYYPYMIDAYQHIIADPNGIADIVTAAKQWNANTVRFIVSQPALDPQNALVNKSVRADYVSEIANIVRQVSNSGLAVIITMQDETPSGEINPSPLPTAATWQAWQTLLPVVTGNQSVMLDIFNEPRGTEDWNVWKYGGTTISASGSILQSVGFQTLVDDFRQASVQNVLIAETLGYRSMGTSTDDQISDPQRAVAYAIHPRAYTFTNNQDQYGLAVGSAFATSTDQAIFNSAFGDAASQVPVLADEWDMLEFTGPAIECQNVPQLAYFEAAYLQKYTAGVVGYALDYPGVTITNNWQYVPRGFADVSQCAGYTDVLHNGGDVGSLLYSWFHGVDLWGSGNQNPSISSLTPSQGVVGTPITISGSGFTSTGNELWCESGCTYSPELLDANLSSADEHTLSYVIPKTYEGVYVFAIENPNGTSNDLSFTVTAPKLNIGFPVFTVDALNVYSDPSVASAIIAAEPEGAEGVIIGGPVTSDKHIFWQVRFDDGTSGWVVDYLGVVGL